MRNSGKSFGFSGEQGVNTSKETGAISRGDSCKLTGAVFLVLIICLFGSASFGQPWDGNGVEGDPYLIYTAEDMQAIGADPNYWDAYFKLTEDINLAEITGDFNSIGYYVDWNNNSAFTGVFDGNGHTISNFIYHTNGTGSVGLFGYVEGYEAEIQNLGLVEPEVDAVNSIQVGALVGYLYNGKMTDCYIEDGNIAGGGTVGGLIGYNIGAKVYKCHFGGSVSGSVVGGLIGSNVGGLVINCSSQGNITGGFCVAGLIGRTHEARVADSYSWANVSGIDWIGGLIAINEYCWVSDCYSAGSVTGSNYTGGLIAVGNPDAVTNSFWDVEVSGEPNSMGGVGKSTAEMYDVNTFRAVGWDFVGLSDGPSDIWSEPNGGGYPVLAWQLEPLANLPVFGGGTGTKGNPYLIATAEHLNSIGCNPRLMDKHFRITSNIDLNDINFNIIGSDFYKFMGSFDGGGFEAANLKLNYVNEDNVGMFGVVEGEHAEIKNLGLIDPDIDVVWNDLYSGRYIGGLISLLLRGTVEDCYVKGGRVSGNDSVGGLIGECSDGSILNCFVEDCNVSGDYSVGGQIGEIGGSIVANCYSTANVKGNSATGGLIGYELGGTVSNCWASCMVDGGFNTGMLAGRTRGDLIDCFAKGHVSGDDRIGGFVGYAGSGSITNCYSESSVVGGMNAGGFAGYIFHGMVSQSYCVGDVTGNTNVGGFVGRNYGGGVANCYSESCIEGGNKVGGLVGENYGKFEPATVDNSYSVGTVSGTSNLGGLVGYKYSGSINNSFWDVNSSGMDTSDGGTGKTTAQMQNPNTFTDAGWDFVVETTNGTEDIWNICDGVDYPKLTWQFIIGDFDGDDDVDFADFAIFAAYWLEADSTFWCGGTDLTSDNQVGLDDLREFVANWLAGK